MARRIAENGKPKKPMTAYDFFVLQCRQEALRKSENGDEPTMALRCNKKWQGMSENVKAKYQELADRDKARCDDASKPEDPNAPKRPLSAFMWFAQDERHKVRAENPRMGAADVAKEIGRRWGMSDQNTKTKYAAIAEQNKGHKNEMANSKGKEA